MGLAALGGVGAYHMGRSQNGPKTGRGRSGAGLEKFSYGAPSFHLSYFVSGLRWHGTCFCLTGRWAGLFFCMISMSFTKKGEENEAMRAFLGFIVESFSHEFYFVLRKLCDLRSDEIGGRSIHINKGSIFVIFSYI